MTRLLRGAADRCRPFVVGCTALLTLLATVYGPAARSVAAQSTTSSDSVFLVIRTDDGGMSHAVNMGIKRLLESGLPVTVSVMFACPWQKEIVEILEQHPEAAVGVHLTLNSEWRNYRWGPVIGREAAASLVDEQGYFCPSAEALYDNPPDLGQV